MKKLTEGGEGSSFRIMRWGLFIVTNKSKCRSGTAKLILEEFSQSDDTVKIFAKIFFFLWDTANSIFSQFSKKKEMLLFRSVSKTPTIP